MATSTQVAKLTQTTVSRFTPDEIELIKRTICKGASDDELRMFLYQCERTGLDPIARQIYSVERKEKRGDAWVAVRSIQTSIDGFRLVAERSGKYSGQLGPFWCGSDGQWRDVWLVSTPPIAARVGVLRHDFQEPCWGVARFDAYAQKGRDGSPTRMWAGMPDVMLAKCAEALALRKAFPQDLSGLYTSDEMEQAAVEVEPPAPKVNPSPIKPQTVKAPENPHVIAEPDDAKWVSLFAAAIRAAKTAAEINEWQTVEATRLDKIEIERPKTYTRIMTGIEDARQELLARVD